MPNPLCVLIVEDSESDAELVVRLFRKAGYQVTSRRVETRDTMVAALAQDTWDSVIADHNMPEFDAFAALETLRSSGLDIPFIVVWGSIGEEAAVTLMKTGAADYVMKGKLARLTAAVERELRDAADRRERRQAIDALRASEEKYRRLFDLESDALFLIDRDSGRILEANAGATALYGYSHNEWLTMRNVDVSAEPDSTTAATLTGVTAIPMRWHRKKEGTVFPVDITAAHFEWQGRSVHLAAIRDITERKQTEAYGEMGREVLQILNEPGDMQHCIQRVLAAFKTRTGFDAVGIRLQDGDDFPYCVQEGFPKDFLLTENTLIERGADGGVCRGKDGNVSLECTCGLVISGKTDPANPLFTPGGSCWTNDSFPLLDIPPGEDPRLHPRNRCIHQGYASVALVPIRNKDRIVGLIQLNDRRKGRFSLETVELLEGIASHIGAALMRKRAEEALRESEERHRTILQTAMDGFWLTDMQGRLLEVNETYCRMSGYSTQELLAMRIPDLEAAEAADDTAARIQRLMAQGEGRFESRHHRKDGSIFDVEVSVQYWANEVGRMVAFLRDISERRRAEDQLRQSEADLRQAQHVAHVGSWHWDIKADHLTWSDEMYRIFDIAKEGFSGSLADVIARAIHPGDRPKVEASNLSVIQQGKPIPVEYRVVWADGSVRVVWAEAGELTRDEAGNPAALTGIVLDITDRKRVEETLRQSEEKLRLVANFTHDWEYWLRPDGVMSYVSPACERITGYSADEFMNDPGLLERIIHPADADIFAGHLRDTLNSGAKPAEVVYRIVTKAGAVRWIGHSCQAVHGSDGAWLGERASNRDITQRTEDLRQLRQRTAQLEALRQVSLSLTAQLDLNTLLHSIISQAAALLEVKSGVLFLHRPDLDALEWVVGVGLTPSLTGSLLRRGEGLSGRVWQTGEPMMVADYQGWEGRAARYEGEAIGALIGVPVRWGDDFLGVINVAHDSPRAFSASDVEMLTLFASVAAIAIRNARALAEEAAHRRVAEALGRATRAVANALGLDALLESLLGAALEATPAADGGGVLLWEDETRELVVKAAVGFSEPAVRQLRFAAGRPAPLWQAFEGEALLLPDVVANMGQENPLAAVNGIRSAILAPLRYGGKGIGVLVLTCAKSKGSFTTGDLSLVTAIADQCAVAVENARLAADAQMKAILEERQRLARDLHDSVTQSLYGLTLFTQASREWAAAGDLERVQGQLARIAETAQQALKEMRLLVYELRPFNLQNEGIVSALNRRLDSVERRAGVDAHLWADVEGSLPPIAEETLFRVAQEALANALKHAHAARVSVYLRTRDGRAELEVVDDGAGFDTEAVRGQGGMGLASMRERMERVGGSIAVTALPGEGTRVKAVMPILVRPVDTSRNR